MKEEKKYICENCKTREVERHNETIRDKNTKIAKIMSVCNFCFRKITGAK